MCICKYIFTPTFQIFPEVLKTPLTFLLTHFLADLAPVEDDLQLDKIGDFSAEKDDFKFSESLLDIDSHCGHIIHV